MTLVPFHGEQDEPGAEIDHYTYVFQSDGLSVYGGVDSFRDTYGEMRESLARVRDEHKPTVAFLPISRMVYAYRDGGVNGFCRYMDTSLLDQSFQYTAGPSEAAEWVRELGVSTVVPYATFTFKPRATPGEVVDFAQALDRAGLGAHLLPLATLGAVEPSDLDGSARALRRRRSPAPLVHHGRQREPPRSPAQADPGVSLRAAAGGRRRVRRAPPLGCRIDTASCHCASVLTSTACSPI
jgi:hypothetical protein